MKISCDIIRDLLPLYADEACSDESRRMVEDHLQECPDCGRVLDRLKSSEIEEDLKREKNDVISYGARAFKKRTATVGGTISGLFMIPILVCLIINITTGGGLSWFFIVLAALAVAASLILVPILVPEDKAFWTFCAFCASLMILLGITCLVSGGNWFWVASSAALFGLGVIFLPFVIRARPVQKWIGDSNKVLIVIAADLVLFLNMMTAINLRRNMTGNGWLLLIGVLAGVGLAVLEIMKNRGERK